MPTQPRTTKRQCAGTSKRTGQPCRCTGVLPNGYCLAHQPPDSTLVPADQRFGSPAQARAAATGVKRRYPRLREIVEAEIEAKALPIVKAALEQLDAQALLVDKDGVEHWAPDGRTRLQAAQYLIDRGLGRPHQSSTVEATSRGLVVKLDGADPQARAQLAEILRSRPAAGASEPDTDP